MLLIAKLDTEDALLANNVLENPLSSAVNAIKEPANVPTKNAITRTKVLNHAEDFMRNMHKSRGRFYAKYA